MYAPRTRTHPHVRTTHTHSSTPAHMLARAALTLKNTMSPLMQQLNTYIKRCISIHGMNRPLCAFQIVQHVNQLVNRRYAQMRISGMCRFAVGNHTNFNHSFLQCECVCECTTHMLARKHKSWHARMHACTHESLAVCNQSNFNHSFLQCDCVSNV